MCDLVAMGTNRNNFFLQLYYVRFLYTFYSMIFSFFFFLSLSRLISVAISKIYLLSNLPKTQCLSVGKVRKKKKTSASKSFLIINTLRQMFSSFFFCYTSMCNVCIIFWTTKKNLLPFFIISPKNYITLQNLILLRFHRIWMSFFDLDFIWVQ